MPGIDSLIVGAATTGAQIATAANANKKARRFARRESEKSRRFAAQQSATVAQRAVVDLKAAGLNPILAAKSFGGGSAASGTALGAPQQDTTAVSQGLNAARLTQELANLSATEDKTNAEKFGQDQVNIIREPAAMAGREIVKGLKAVKGHVSVEYDRATSAMKQFHADKYQATIKTPINYKNAPRQGPKRRPAKYRAGTRGQNK